MMLMLPTTFGAQSSTSPSVPPAYGMVKYLFDYAQYTPYYPLKPYIVRISLFQLCTGWVEGGIFIKSYALRYCIVHSDIVVSADSAHPPLQSNFNGHRRLGHTSRPTHNMDGSE